MKVGNNLSLGNMIKNKRKNLNLTQAELANNICAQSMLSKIERDELIPSNKILEQIANKLNIDFSKLKDNSQQIDEKKNIHDIKKIIRSYLEKREYESISILLENMNQKKWNLESEDIVFFQWIEASTYYYKTKDSVAAFEKFKLINYDEISNDLRVEVTNALGRIYYLEKNFDKALTIFENAYSYSEGIRPETRAKLSFNYVLALEEKNRDKEALEIVIRAIKLLVKNNSLLALGDLYHTKGYLLRKLGYLEEAKKSNQIALCIFEIQNNVEFKIMTQIEIDELKKEIKKM